MIIAIPILKTGIWERIGNWLDAKLIRNAQRGIFWTNYAWNLRPKHIWFAWRPVIAKNELLDRKYLVWWSYVHRWENADGKVTGYTMLNAADMSNEYWQRQQAYERLRAFEAANEKMSKDGLPTSSELGIPYPRIGP